MKLTKFRVTNFRSVEDSGDIEVGQTLCLVGKNEAGKTAVLHALAGLNPHPATPISFDIERDYPRRHLPEYATRHKDKQAVVVRTEWTLSEEEKAAVTEVFGEKALKDGPVVVLRRYGSDKPEWDLPVDFGAVVEHLLDEEGLKGNERKPFSSAGNTQQVREAFKGIANPTEKQKRLIARLDGMAGQYITGGVQALVADKLPHFMYFSHYDRMTGQIRLDTFKARERGQTPPPIEQGERVFLDFLEYAGTSVEEISEAKTYESLNAKCEGASIRITQQLLEYWTQNPHLEIEVRVTRGEPGDTPPFNEGVIARARVKNNLHKVTVPFSERSAGFIWFF